MVDNLVTKYLSLADQTDGREWYFKANEFCQTLAIKYNLDLPIVCAIVSALSPSTNWEQNKKDTVKLLDTYSRNKTMRVNALRLTTYGQNVRKAHAILKGKLSPFEAFSLKTGPKTYNFFYNILRPNDPDFVTIDRHAYTVAFDEKYDKGIKTALYKRIASLYVEASKQVGILPNQLQAILWVNHRKETEIKFEEYQPF